MMKKWSEIIRNNWDDIKEKAVEAYRKAEGAWNSFHVDVEIDTVGNISISDPLSQGGQSGESWNGETCIVVRTKGWTAEIEDIRDSMKNSDKYEGTNYIEEFEAQEEEFDEHSWMKGKYPEKYKEWLEEWKEFEVERFEQDVVDSLIQEAVLFEEEEERMAEPY
jgi:hypothetical protein